MTTWQILITVHVLMSTIMSLYARRLSLRSRGVFFAIGVLSYLMVALFGLIYGTIATGGTISWPSATAWIFIIVEGVFIPMAWLLEYKIISNIGAGNSAVAGTLYKLAAAMMGIILLQEALSIEFAIGAVLILSSALLSLKIKPDVDHVSSLAAPAKIGLLLIGSILFGIGMYAEKSAVSLIGPWDYMWYGWSMQFVGALVIFLFYGRGEIQHLTPSIIRQGLFLGVLTVTAGGLYIWALSLGSLSQTVIAAGAKTALIIVFAALFLREHNAIPLRITAFIISTIGLWLVLQ